MRASDNVEIDDVYIEHTTDKAALCVIDGEKHWIPLGHIQPESEIFKKGDEGKLIITRWMAEQKGLVEE